MTDRSRPPEPQPGDTSPQRGRDLPERAPQAQAQGEPASPREPASSGSFWERAAPGPAAEHTARRFPGNRGPRDDDATAEQPLHRDSDRQPQHPDQAMPPDSALPWQDGSPSGGRSLAPRADSLASRREPLPPRSGGPAFRRPSPELLQRVADQLSRQVPQEPGSRGEARPPGDPLPQRDTPADVPQRDTPASAPQALPQRGGTADGLSALPRRTNRTRPAGRHRSPHRLSVASDAPALVLAVPGTAAADSGEIGPRVAFIAGESCPGVDIRVGYLDGTEATLAESLLPAGPEPEDHDPFPSVIVPLLLSPNAQFDPVIVRLAAEPSVPAVVAGHLGPHPMVAEALHSRLAEAGLARQARTAGLSISADDRGIVVLADIGQEAASAAGVAAVLLASRLSVPVVPASLGDPGSIVDAVNRLTESGAQRPVLAPCLIGPETKISVLEDLSEALGAPCAPTLGAHQAVGRLVAIRYGAALTSLSLAG